MPDETLISIIIPAYNEEAGIGDTIAAVRTVMEKENLNYELLLVDDGSQDKTAEVAEAGGAEVIRRPYNMGNGAAVKAGLRGARGDYVVLLDADGQHPPEDIPNLLKYCERYDMVVGARNASTHATRVRRWGNMLYNSLATYITGTPILDLTSGFRVIKRTTARKFIYLLPNGFSYPTTITLSLIKAGYSVKYVPFSARPREGKSKLNTAYEALRFFGIILKIATLFSPFKVFFPISVFSLTLGLAYGSYMIIVNQHFSNMVLLLLITGLLIFLLGLIAEEIALLRLDRSDEGP